MTKEDVLSIVDACFHMFASSYRAEAKELATELLNKRNHSESSTGILEHGSWFIFGKGMADTVTITKEEYDSLFTSEKTLLALEGAGVVNWDGYDGAIESMESLEEEE